MKLCAVIFGVLVACAVSYALEQGPLMQALQPQYEPQAVMLVEPQGTRQKRSLLLGGAGLAGAGLVGAGLLGAGALGAGLIGAKAGFVGGALAAKAFSGRSYGGGYGYGHGYGGGYGHGYSGGYGHGYGGGYGGGYYAEPVVYHRSYPTYYVEDEWC